MKRWWLMIALLLSVGINVGILATLAFQSRSPAKEATVEPPDRSAEAPREEREPRIIRRMADELRLEGEKRAAFTQIQRTFFEQTLAARSRMARLQREIRAEVTATDPDRDALDQLLVELSAAHTDLERAFVINLLDSRELLDGEQERRFMHFLRRIRHVRGEVERRFRDRWQAQGERRERLGPRLRERRGPGQRFEQPPPSPPENPSP